MSDYKPASHRSKEMTTERNKESQERRVKPVVTGQAKTKKNEGRKLMNTFISEDAANVKTYVFMDVLVPAIKKAISDIVTNGIDMILYGETRGNRSSSGSKVSYRSYYDDRNGRSSGRSSYESARSSGTRFDYDDVTFASRRDAIAVREELYAISRDYGFARVLDLYDLANITADYTASNYGWFHLDNVDVIQLRNGDWTLKLPKAMPIDRN